MASFYWGLNKGSGMDIWNWKELELIEKKVTKAPIFSFPKFSNLSRCQEQLPKYWDVHVISNS